MTIHNKPTKIISFLRFSSISSIVLFVTEVFNESSSSSAVFFIFSKLKVIELVGLLVLSIFLIGLAVMFQFSSIFQSKVLTRISNHKNIGIFLLYVSTSIFLGSLGIATIIEPPILLIKIRPFIYWLLFISGLASLLLLQKSFPSILQKLRRYWLHFSFTFIFVFFGGVIYLFIAGNNPAIDPGQSTITVPWHQGLIMIWVILTSEYVKSFSWIKKINPVWVTLITVISLFVVSGLVWTSIPFRGAYNSFGPFPPGMEWFPHSDSVRFDFAAQTIFIGEGINYRNYVDNPLMVSYVAFLHFLRGGSFSAIISLQIWIFAVGPVLVFLAGKKLLNFSAGFGSAILYFFRMNNILLNTRNHGLSSPRILISEGILELLLITLGLFFLYWAQGKANNFKLLAIIGGLFGLTALVRANVWFILPVLIISVFLISSCSIWKKVTNCLIIILAVLFTLLPWMWRSERTIDTPFFMLYKFQNSISRERYQISQPVIQKESRFSLVSQIRYENKSNNSTILLSPHDNKYLEIFSKAAESFVFNFTNSILILPFESKFLSTSSGVISPNLIYKTWSGFEPFSKVFSLFSLLITLGFLSFGTVYVVKRKTGGCFLIAVFFAYIIASSMALTQGSRYTQPVEWIIILLFTGGVSFFLQSFFCNSRKNDNKELIFEHEIIMNGFRPKNFINIGSAFLIAGILIILGISIAIVLPDYLGESRYFNNSKETLTQELYTALQTSNNDSSKKEIELFLASPNSNINKGRIIYSLPLNGDKVYDHEFFVQNPYVKPNGKDMVAVYIISKSGGEWVKLNLQQQDWPKQSLVWKDALYLGCLQGKTTQASKLIIINEDSSEAVYLSNPKISCNDNVP